MISGNTFDVLGISPVRRSRLDSGRRPQPGAHPVVVLSHDYWQRRFAGSPAVLNQAVTINSTPMTIVGVAPARFCRRRRDADRRTCSCR